MSRIGKKSIIVPSNVQVDIQNQLCTVSGPHGKLSRQVDNLITLSYENGKITLSKKNNSRPARELYGLSRTLINNMVIGVAEKFEQRLEIKGVGYRSQLKDKSLILNLGYSHPITMRPPEDIEIIIESNTVLVIKGINKEVVGQFAATVRGKRPPEPYKGKGILYKGEIIKRKVGKSGK